MLSIVIIISFKKLIKLLAELEIFLNCLLQKNLSNFWLLNELLFLFFCHYFNLRQKSIKEAWILRLICTDQFLKEVIFDL